MFVQAQDAAKTLTDAQLTGVSALFVAAQYDHYEICKILIGCGANVDRKNV